MAITLNRLAVECEKIAVYEGKLSEDSSSRALIYEISRNWRILCDTTKEYKLGETWSEREKAAATLLITTLGYLHRIGCKDVESLLKERISMLAPT